MRLAWAALAAITIVAGALQAIVTGQAVTAGASSGQPQARPQEPNLGGGIDLDAQDPRIALERLHPADGYDVNLFASEQQFPELANPLAMTFDDRGRLWSSCPRPIRTWCLARNRTTSSSCSKTRTGTAGPTR